MNSGICVDKNNPTNLYGCDYKQSREIYSSEEECRPHPPTTRNSVPVPPGEAALVLAPQEPCAPAGTAGIHSSSSVMH